MISACVQGERQGCRKQRSCFSADYPSMNNRGTYEMYSQFLIKKTPLGLFRKLQKTKRKEKNSKAGPLLCPQVPGHVTERKALQRHLCRCPQSLPRSRCLGQWISFYGLASGAVWLPSTNAEVRGEGHWHWALVRVAPAHCQLFQ